MHGMAWLISMTRRSADVLVGVRRGNNSTGLARIYVCGHAYAFRFTITVASEYTMTGNTHHSSYGGIHECFRERFEILAHSECKNFSRKVWCILISSLLPSSLRLFLWLERFIGKNDVNELLNFVIVLFQGVFITKALLLPMHLKVFASINYFLYLPLIKQIITSLRSAIKFSEVERTL